MREVVGVAVLREGRVLAARRSGPPALAGLWEFPGGKVEPNEDPGATAVREIAEELRCTVEVTGWVDKNVDDGPDDSAWDPGTEYVLRVATARLVDDDPVPTEHDAVRWLRADQLDEVTWAGADVPFLDPVRRLLDMG
jgi:8-oxo-dGTP diphosphatase